VSFDFRTGTSYVFFFRVFCVTSSPSRRRAGFIGSHLVEGLVAGGVDVVVIDVAR
jgi:hypothetical protein